MTLPEIRWEHGDGLCDCTFQRIGTWTNPYIARTLEVRLCCMWKKLDEQWPGLVRDIPAFTDYNNGDRFVTEPMIWNGEDDMPEALWHRQTAAITGKPLSEVREKFAGMKPPAGVKRKPVEQPVARREVTASLYEIIGKQQEEIEKQRHAVSVLLGVLQKLKSGEIALESLTVTADSIQINTVPQPVAVSNGAHP